MQEHHDNKFFSGFLLGLIIGSAIVFLLATKTGKKILKLISEEGFGKISDIVDKYDLEEDQEEEVEGVDTVVEKPGANGEAQIKKSKRPRFFKKAK